MTMPQPILVGHDPRRPERGPVRFGAAAARLTGAPLLVVAVHAGRALPGQHVDEDLLPDCTDVVAELDAELQSAGVDVQCRALEGTTAARALHEAAEREGAGLVVVGVTDRPRAPEALLGSTADRLVHGAPCPIAVVPHGWAPRAKIATIGVGFVDTEEGHEALRAGHALARLAGATLRVIAVVSVGPRRYAEIRPSIAGQRGTSIEDVEGEHKLEALRAARAAVAALEPGFAVEPGVALEARVAVEVEAPVGDPVEVLAAASEHLDVLVCGARGYGPMRAVLLGSVSHALTAQSHCPVVILPRGVPAALDALIAEDRRAAAPA
jgi:nucleotide-binding universal stress UspA family protein